MKKLGRFEPYLFYLLCAANLIPVFLDRFMPSLDGPAHLYNSQLIGSLVEGGHKTIENCFAFNERPVPNWSGHFMLALFNSFLPAYVAEKIVLVFYLLGLPLGFRAILYKQQQANVAFSCLAIPFTYSLVFCLGFYNFSIAIVVALFVFYHWLNALQRNPGWKSVFTLALLTAICFFSHVFVFVILITGLGTLSFLFYVHQLFAVNANIRQVVKMALRSGLFLLIAVLPALILFVKYGYRNSHEGQVYVSHEELIKWLVSMVPLVGYHVGLDIAYTEILLWFLVLMAIATFVFWTFHVFRRTADLKGMMLRLTHPVNTWLLLALLLLVLYFKMPDMEAGAGYVTMRLLYLFYFFMVLWLCAIARPRWMASVAVLVVIYCCVHLALNRRQVSRNMLNVANEYYDLAEKIQANSIVLPINVSSSWDYGHFSGYLGAEKPLALLDNYECQIDYFPLTWNVRDIPKFTFGRIDPLSNPACLNWKTDTTHAAVKIDYVFVNGHLKNLGDSCRSLVNEALNRDFKIIYSSANCELYKRK